MKVIAIGRSEILFASIKKLVALGHQVVMVVTAKASPESAYTDEKFKMLADEIGAEYLYAPNLNDEKNVDKLRQVGPFDIGVSVNYVSIIPEKVISLFKHGILNAHGGDLPRYKGNACQAWAIINGESEIALCIHKMVGDVLDDGDIISRRYMPITINTKIAECYRWMLEVAPDMFAESLTKLAEDSSYVLENPSHSSRKGLRCYPRRPEDGKIDWKNTSESILRLINASGPPFSGAFCHYEGHEFKIWDAELEREKEAFLAVPGQVCEIDKHTGSAVVACGVGLLRVLSVSYLENSVEKPSKYIHSIRKRLT